jgi:hypothetical protein
MWQGWDMDTLAHTLDDPHRSPTDEPPQSLQNGSVLLSSDDGVCDEPPNLQRFIPVYTNVRGLVL